MIQEFFTELEVLLSTHTRNRFANELGRRKLRDRRGVEGQTSISPRSEQGEPLTTSLGSASIILGHGSHETPRVLVQHSAEGMGSPRLRVSERQVLGRSSWQDEFREEVPPQRAANSDVGSANGNSCLPPLRGNQVIVSTVFVWCVERFLRYEARARCAGRC